MPEKPGSRPVTMNDVAKRAGVSQTTVSFVINENESVSISDETRERVWQAVADLGYRPNAAAQSLRRSRTNLIGFITDYIATTPHAGLIFKAAQEVAWANNKILLLVNTDGKEDLKDAAVEMMLDRQVEGIIYATMYHRLAHPPASIREAPAVLLDCFDEARSLPSVVPDEVQGGHTATEQLLFAGHRRIGFINNVHLIPATFGRLQGYKMALAAAEVPFDEALVRCDVSDAAGGYRCTMDLMVQPDPPTGLFCFNDRMAMGVYDALRKLGKRIPEDVAVVGFDNQELIAAHLHPGLSTIQLPHYEMGLWAVQKLLAIIGGHDEDGEFPVQHIAACPYVPRASV
jgi:LacI family transcriptional regulator